MSSLLENIKDGITTITDKAIDNIKSGINQLEMNNAYHDIDMYNYFNINRTGITPDYTLKGIPYIFFSTPMMNMSQENCQADSFLTYLMTFQPELLEMLNYGTPQDKVMTTTSPFIKLLSNTAVSFSPTDTTSDSKEIGETFTGHKILVPASNVSSMVGGDVSVRFKDLDNIPVLKLINAWFVYHNLVRVARISPTLDCIQKGYLDYTSSIYYFLTSMDGQSLTYWCKFTGVVPTNVPFSTFGSNFDNSHEIVDFDINFLYSYKEDMQPDILLDFNKLAGGESLDMNFNYEEKSYIGTSEPPAYNENNYIGKTRPMIVVSKYPNETNGRQKFMLVFLDDK